MPDLYFNLFVLCGATAILCLGLAAFGAAQWVWNIL